MAEVFISYSRADLEAVNVLVQDLGGLGYEPWFDQALTGGQRWWDNILSQIRDCEFFICTLTPDSLESQACKRELDYALRLGKPVLPLLLSDKIELSSLPRVLSELQIVNFTLQDKQALHALGKAIRNLPRAAPLPDPLPEPPPVPISYLTTMKEKIETPPELEYAEQIALVIELRDHFREGRPAKEVCELLHLLKARKDLLFKVSEEIDDVLDQIRRGHRGAARAKTAAEQTAAPLVPSDEGDRDQPLVSFPKDSGGLKRAPEERKACPPEGAADDEGTRQLQLESPVEECKALMERVLDRGEVWVFEIDTANCFTIEWDDAAEALCIKATATLRDGVGGAKAKALKALGWKVQADTLIKGAVGSAALYATGGLAAVALLSRNVRDVLMSFTGTRCWTLTKGVGRKEALARAAAELATAIQRVAAEAKTIVVTRKAETLPA
jgi:TIR domain-containing protein